MTDSSEKPYDLFISYADADRAWVQGYLLDALTQAGVRCLTEATFRLGAPRLEEFERAVRQSRRILLVFSSTASVDGFGRFIDLLAQTHGVEAAEWPVIPILRAAVQLPTRLAMLTGLDATDASAWPEVVERLCAELQRPTPGPAARPACPYPGIVPFGAEQARFFYGRDDEVEQALQRLRHQRSLFVIGPSGSGKSSLVHAGLLPRLGQNSYFPPAYWLVRAMRPGSTPFQTLTGILGGDPARPSRALADLLAKHPPAQRLLLVVDQFEEIFTWKDDPAGQSRFVSALKGLRAEETCAVLLGLRADFYAELMNSPLWPVEASERLEIGPLRGEGLRQAIKKPAEEAGVFLEAGLLERLLADAAEEPGALPLVQETMVQLWNQMERRLLPYSAYERLGREGRSGLAVAMSTKADATLAELSEAQRKMARRILLRLIQFGQGRADTRRQQSVTALSMAGVGPELLEQTLQHLARNRLLTLGGDEQERDRTVDIAHEALIGGWPALRQWVEERREAEQARRRLEAKAAEWAERGRGRYGLLDEAELPEAERWLGSPDAADLGHDEALAELVRASREAIEQAGREQEAARQRELEQARRLAEAQQRELEQAQQAAREQQRANRLLRNGVGAALVLTLAALIAAGVAWVFQREASAKQKQAEMAEKEASAKQKQAETAEKKARQAEAAAKDLLIRLALGRGSWSEALAQIDQELAEARPDSVELRLNKVKALCALHRLTEASRLLDDLQKEDLGPQKGSVLLWKTDLELAGSLRNDCKADLIRARNAGLPPAEDLYARALLAPTMAELVASLEGALKEDPLAQRANAILGMTWLLSGEEVKARERISFGEFFFPEDPNFRVLRMLLETREGDARAADVAARWLMEKSDLSKQEVKAAFALRGMLQVLLEVEASIAGTSKGLAVTPWSVLRHINDLRAGWELITHLSQGGGTALPLPPLFLEVWDGGRLAKVQAGVLLGSFRPVGESANDELTRMTARHPDALLYYLQGLVLVELKRYSDAEKAFRQAAIAKSFLRVQRAAKTGVVGCQIMQRIDGPPLLPSLIASAAGEVGGVPGLWEVGWVARSRLDVQYAGALRHLRELVAEGDVHPDFAEGFAAFALLTGEVELARQIVGGWERNQPNNKDVRFLRARVEFEAGAYGRVLEIARTFAPGDRQYKEMKELEAQARDSLARLAEAVRNGP
jgi:hypothetical protein